MHLPMPDPEPVTIAVFPSRRIASAPFRHHAVSFGPAQPVLGAGARLVFAADPSLVAGAVDRLEHGGIIDLAFVRFVARRYRSDLNVPDDRQMFFEALELIAVGNLDVIKIKLDAYIRRAYLAD